MEALGDTWLWVRRLFDGDPHRGTATLVKKKKIPRAAITHSNCTYQKMQQPQKMSLERDNDGPDFICTVLTTISKFIHFWLSYLSMVFVIAKLTGMVVSFWTTHCVPRSICVSYL